MKDQTRNLNPTAEAVVAMYIYGHEYSQQGGGSMDFWDSLPESKKRVCRELLVKIDTARSQERKDGE